MNPQSGPILIVEDSDEDYEVTLRAFQLAGLHNPVYRCRDGDEALDFLHHRPPFSNPEMAPRPSLILLDLNLPGADGRDILNEIKSSPYLKTIPVLILTTSPDDRDIESCYSFGANSYIKKPMGLDRFVEAVRRVRQYWFDIVMLPPAS